MFTANTPSYPNSSRIDFNMASLQLTPHLTRLFCLLALSMIPASLFGQGCVISRGSGGATILDGSGFLEAKQWQLTVAHRWIDSDRHFVGDDEQKHRQAQGTEVINNTQLLDIIATDALS